MEPVILKVCSACDRVRKYGKGDKFPHWATLTPDEWMRLMNRGFLEHHTLCPECREKNGASQNTMPVS